MLVFPPSFSLFPSFPSIWHNLLLLAFPCSFLSISDSCILSHSSSFSFSFFTFFSLSYSRLPRYFFLAFRFFLFFQFFIFVVDVVVVFIFVVLDSLFYSERSYFVFRCKFLFLRPLFVSFLVSFFILCRLLSLINLMRSYPTSPLLLRHLLTPISSLTKRDPIYWFLFTMFLFLSYVVYCLLFYFHEIPFYLPFSHLRCLLTPISCLVPRGPV